MAVRPFKDIAYDILIKAGEPMHVREITTEVNKVRNIKSKTPQNREFSKFCVIVWAPGSDSTPAEVKARSENGPSICHVGGVGFCWSEDF